SNAGVGAYLVESFLPHRFSMNVPYSLVTFRFWPSTSTRTGPRTWCDISLRRGSGVRTIDQPNPTVHRKTAPCSLRVVTLAAYARPRTDDWSRSRPIRLLPGLSSSERAAARHDQRPERGC